MKTLRILCFLLVSLATTTFTNAQTCSGFGPVLKTGWQHVYNAVHPIGKDMLKLIPVAGQNKEFTDAVSDSSEALHKFIFEDNRQSWTTVGARALFVPDREHGNLAKMGVGGARTFTTAPLFYDEIDITIHKTDGKAKTTVAICTYDSNTGNKMNVREYTFENGKGSKKKTFTIKNVFGKSVSVFLKNRSVANTFKYTISSKGRSDSNKQKQRVQANGGNAGSKKRPVTRYSRGNR